MKRGEKVLQHFKLRDRAAKKKQENQFEVIYIFLVVLLERTNERRNLFDSNNNVIIGNCVLFCAKKFTCVHAKIKWKEIRNYAKLKPTQAFMQFTSFRREQTE